MPTIFRCIMKKSCGTLLVKAVMTEVPDLNGAEGKRIFDKAQLMLFFLYLNALCAGIPFILQRRNRCIMSWCRR